MMYRLVEKIAPLQVAAAILIGPKYANFTNTAFGSSGNPQHNFAASTTGGNTTLGDIGSPAANSILYTMNCTASASCYAYYQYAATYSMVDAIVAVGSSSVTIPVANFVTTASALTSGASGTVYQNAANRTVIAKVVYASPSTVQFDVVQGTSNSNPPPCCGGNPPPIS